MSSWRENFLIGLGFIAALVFVAAFVAVFSPKSEAMSHNTGLVGYWKLDEGVDVTAADSSGNNFTGTLTNGPQWASGIIGNALLFDGADDYVMVGHQAALEGMAQLSIFHQRMGEVNGYELSERRRYHCGKIWNSRKR